MSEAALAHDTDDERLAWRVASKKSRPALEDVLSSWGAGFDPRYKDGSREPLRDETFHGWLEQGALRVRPGVATTSSKGRWALVASFADLFSPALTGADLTSAIDAWRDANMSPGAKLKAQLAVEREHGSHKVEVRLPNGSTRSLEPGDASRILKGVIEEWAPKRLGEPVVLAISEPGAKIYTNDAATLRRLGIAIDVSNVLPDALLADVATNPVTFWIVEAVATDGPITEARRKKLIDWATDQDVSPESCEFLSAFISRADSAAKRRLKDLAVGTYAWYADEPGHELAWYELQEEERDDVRAYRADNR